MDIESLRATLEQAGAASLLVGFLAGFLFSFNPVALAAIPVSLAYVTKAREPRQALRFGAMFIVGMALTHLLLGLVAGLGGAWAQQLLGRRWGVVLGPFLILLGLMWPGWIRLPVPRIAIRAKRVVSVWGAAGLGGVFSVAICPACTPALVILLGVALGIGSPVFGAVLLLAFALGRAVPIALGACAVGWLETLAPIGRYLKPLEAVGGVVLILSGLYMLNAVFFWVPQLAA